MRNWPPPRAEDDGGAVIAFTNPGGIRTDVAEKEPGGVELRRFVRQPAVPQSLVTLTLTGSQIKSLLEQQWLDPKRPRILQVSNGFSYTWDNARPYGERVIADSMKLNGARIDPTAGYRVTVNDFLSAGGDGFSVLKQATPPRVGIYDIDALDAYFQAHSPVSPGGSGRIVRVN